MAAVKIPSAELQDLLKKINEAIETISSEARNVNLRLWTMVNDYKDDTLESVAQEFSQIYHGISGQLAHIDPDLTDRIKRLADIAERYERSRI